MGINLRMVLKLLRHNLPLVLSTTLVGLVSLVTLSFMSTPQYSSGVQLFVSTPANALDLSSLSQGSTFSQQRVKSYADIINGPLTLIPVIKKLNLQMTAHELSQHISAKATESTVLIEVQVSTPDPILSANIANAVGVEFSKTASQLEFGDSTNGIHVTVVRDAIPSTTPSSPRYTLNMLVGVVLGFIFGLILCFIKYYFNSTVKNVDHIGDYQLLSAIGFDSEADTNPLITSINKYSARTESFRQLRTAIMHKKGLLPKKSSKLTGYVVSFTSSVPGEGKTTTCINLALSMVASGERVLFIEADLRRPTANKYFATNLTSKGLSELLNSNRSTSSFYNEIIKLDPKTKLNLVASGKIPPNAGELLISDKFSSFMEYCRSKFDYILIDTPPLLPVSDALAMSRLSDGVVIVVHAGKTRTAQLEGVTSRLESINSEVLGIVLNKIPEDARDYEDYGYRYESSSYGYRGYFSRKYGRKYSETSGTYGYSPDFKPRHNTYPPRPSDALRLAIEEDND